MNTDHRLADYFIVYVAGLLFFAVGAITSLGLDWYRALTLPAWAPSTTLVALIWCVLFALAAASACLVWNRALPNAAPRLVGLYAGNAFLVLLWNYLFFGLRSFDLAFTASLLVLLSVLVLLAVSWRVSRMAALLLLPYLAWMILAIPLTHLIYTLNL